MTKSPPAAKGGAPAAAPAAAAAAVKAAAVQEEKAKVPAKEIKLKTPVTRKVTSSGLQYEVLKVGRGSVANIGKMVQVRYEGFLTNGRRFDKGNIRFRLGLGEVIRGWDEGVKGMVVGEQRRLLIPARLGYGVEGSPPVIPPNSNLIFEVGLINC